MTLGWIIITSPRCLLGKTFFFLYLLLYLPPPLWPGWVSFFLSGRVEWARGGGGGIKRSEASFHWQNVSVKDRGLMIGAARKIIYPESEDVWLQSSSHSSSGGTSSLCKCTIKMRCSHNTLAPSHVTNQLPASYLLNSHIMIWLRGPH